MAEPTPADKVKDKEYTNWLKMTLALYYMKSGLNTFIQSEIDSLHQSIVQKIYAGQTVQLSRCTTCNPRCVRRNKHTEVWKFRTQCKLSCNAWFDELLALHVNPKSDKIYWDNSNVSLWPFNPWECAKVYLPRGQQPVNTGPTKSDAQALLVLLTNCKHFHSKLSSQGQTLLPKISKIRNKVIHNGEMKVSDADRMSFIKQIIELLKDPVCLVALEECNTAVSNIRKIDSDSVDVSFNLGLPMPALSAAVNELRQELGMKENTNADNIDSLKEEFIKLEKKVTSIEDVEKKFELHRKNTEERFENIEKKIDLQEESTTKKLEDLEMNLLLHSENITKRLQDVELELCSHGEGAVGERHSEVEEEVVKLLLENGQMTRETTFCRKDSLVQKPNPKSQKKKKNGNWKPSEKKSHTGETKSDPFFAMETENLNQEGTVKPYDNFNADQDAEVLRNAMKGIGTDEKTLINVLCYRSNPQRQEIALAYKTMFGKDLVKDIKSETSGNFFETLKALLMVPAEYDAYQLRKAMKILRTDKDVLIGILCTRSNAQIKEIIKVYSEKFNRDLEKDIESCTSGDLRCFLISLVLANRSDSKEVDRNMAMQDAKDLYQAGEKKWGADESKFNQILVSQSYPQLRATFEEYSSLSKKDMEEVLKSELSGDILSGMQTIVRCVRNKFAHFSQQLEMTIKKLGTDDNTLIRIVVSRCEIDMVQIKEEFLKLTSQTLEQYIADHLSGDYKNAILALVWGGPPPEMATKSGKAYVVAVKAKTDEELDEEVRMETENIQDDSTVKPVENFNAKHDAETLKKAMKGWGTDEQAIINVLAYRSNAQRLEIVKTLKTLVGKVHAEVYKEWGEDMISYFDGELSDGLKKIAFALCTSPAEYDAMNLKKAVKGIGTNEKVLIEIICTRTNQQIKDFKAAYKELYGKDLETDVAGDTSGHFKRLLVSLLQANRDESKEFDRNKAKQDAQALFEAGEKKWGTDESRFNVILVSRSYAQLRATFQEYAKLANKDIDDTIQSEMSGDLKDSMLAIVRCIRSKASYFAAQLYKSVKCMVTDNDTLCRVIVSQCEVDMVKIKEEFQRNYKQTLGTSIAAYVSDDYRMMLLALIREEAAIKK